MTRRQLQQLVRLVDDLLDATRLSSNKVQLRREVLDLRQIVREAVDASTVTFQKAQHQLAVTVPEAPVWIDGDRDRLIERIPDRIGETHHEARRRLIAGRRHFDLLACAEHERAEHAADRLGEARRTVLRGRARIRVAAIPGRASPRLVRGKPMDHDRGGGDAGKAFVGGAADVLVGSYDHVLKLREQGMDVMAVGNVEATYAYALMAKKGTPYTALDRLAGQKLGTTGPGARDHALRTLLGYGLDRYRRIAVVDAGRVYAEAGTGYGRPAVELVAPRTIVRSLLGGSSLVERVVVPEWVGVPVRKGAPLGRVEVYAGDRLLASSNLVAASDVSEPGVFGKAWWYVRTTAGNLWDVVT